MLEWIDERLAEAGKHRTGDPVEHSVRPWAAVLRVPTDGGDVWLKAPAAGTAFEVPLYELLAEIAPERVLVPLGVDTERGWVLLPDGGEPFGENIDAAELTRALRAYGAMQRELSPHVGRLLDFGLADMRPQVMAQRFDEALELISGEGMDRVAALRDTYRSWCERLVASRVPASIDHNDLHAWNILAGERFYDWGDAVVAHPFASMLGGLGYSPLEPDELPVVRDAYLEAFSDLGDHADLVEELETACRVAKVARAFTWYRAVAGSDSDDADAPLEAMQSLLDDTYLGRV